MSKKNKTQTDNRTVMQEDIPVEEQTEETPINSAEPAEAETSAEAKAETQQPSEEAQAAQKLQTELEQVKILLAEAAKKQEEYLTMAQRVQADFENFRRRNQNVRKESYDDGTRDFAKEFLPVIDNLERAIAAAQNSPDESLRSGVELVLRQMQDSLGKRGIKAIERVGEVFDPNLENAVMRGEPEDGVPGTVCAVFQKGYEMGGKLIRPAMVKVVPEN